MTLLKNVLQMDLKRAILSYRFWIAAPIISILMLVGESDYGADFILLFQGYHTDQGIAELLTNCLMFDKFKVVFVILLSSIYTGSFCVENSNGYLRMILSRADITDYTQSKFIINTLCVILASVLSFLCFALILAPHRALASDNYENSGYRYLDFMIKHPFSYIFLLGIEFGMIVAAFSAMGLLFSAYQPNLLVSIGLPGFLFFILISSAPSNGPFSVYQMISMGNTIASYDSTMVWLDYAWGIILPFIVILLCGWLFYRKLRWRFRNGNI